MNGSFDLHRVFELFEELTPFLASYQFQENDEVMEKLERKRAKLHAQSPHHRSSHQKSSHTPHTSDSTPQDPSPSKINTSRDPRRRASDPQASEEVKVEVKSSTLSTPHKDPRRSGNSDPRRRSAENSDKTRLKSKPRENKDGDKRQVSSNGDPRQKHSTPDPRLPSKPGTEDSGHKNHHHPGPGASSDRRSSTSSVTSAPGNPSNADGRKQVADMVVRYLTPHYKRGKITSKVGRPFVLIEGACSSLTIHI